MTFADRMEIARWDFIIALAFAGLLVAGHLVYWLVETLVGSWRNRR